jgi:Protein of unknown function (DUF2505)
MARRIEHRASTRWTADQVYAVLVDLTFLRGRLSVLGGTDAKLLEHHVDGGKVSLKLRHGVPSSELPPAVRAFFKGDLVIERMEQWEANGDGGHLGKVQAGIPGVPGHIKGAMRLSDEDGGGSELLMRGEVSVSIPLVGGKIEEIVSGQIAKLLTREFEYATNWLAEHQS